MLVDRHAADPALGLVACLETPQIAASETRRIDTHRRDMKRGHLLQAITKKARRDDAGDGMRVRGRLGKELKDMGGGRRSLLAHLFVQPGSHVDLWTG